MNSLSSNSYGWEQPEIMHTYSVMWHSRLSFIETEQQFLTNMLRKKVFYILESNFTIRSKKLIEDLTIIKQEANLLLEKIGLHKNGLQILFDGIHNDREWDYKHEHRKLMIKMHEFDSKYTNLKKDIFKIMSEAIKRQKQKGETAKIGS